MKKCRISFVHEVQQCFAHFRNDSVRRLLPLAAGFVVSFHRKRRRLHEEVNVINVAVAVVSTLLR